MPAIVSSSITNILLFQDSNGGVRTSRGLLRENRVVYQERFCYGKSEQPSDNGPHMCRSSSSQKCTIISRFELRSHTEQTNSHILLTYKSRCFQSPALQPQIKFSFETFSDPRVLSDISFPTRNEGLTIHINNGKNWTNQTDRGRFKL